MNNVTFGHLLSCHMASTADSSQGTTGERKGGGKKERVGKKVEGGGQGFPTMHCF